MRPFLIEDTPTGVRVTDPTGFVASFNTSLMAEMFIQRRTEVLELGKEGAMAKWIQEEQAERVAIGLPAEGYMDDVIETDVTKVYRVRY